MKDLLPGGKSAFAEQELRASLAWFIRIRWFAGVGVLLAAWFVTTVLQLSVPDVPLYVIGSGILFYNALSWIALGRLNGASPQSIWQLTVLTHVQIGLDYCMMAALIHFTGGLESPAILYFFFHIVISAILLAPQAAYLYTALAVLVVGGTAAFEYMGLVPHVALPEFTGMHLYRSPIYILGIFFFFASTAFVVAYLAVTLNSRVRDHAAQAQDLSSHLERAYGRLQSLYDGAQAVNSTLELNHVLDHLVRGTAEAMKVNACSIYLVDESQTRLRIAATHGLSAAYVNKGDLVLASNPLAREVLAGGVIAIHDITKDSRLQYPAAAIAEGIRSMLSAPLVGKQVPLGLIRAYSSEPDHFTQADEAFLSAIASYGSIALENAIAYQAVSKLDQAKSKFILTVTHELRSPVAVVRSLLRTLTGGYAGKLTAEQGELVGRALHRADFLQTLIEDLLHLAAGKSELQASAERVPVPLNDILEQVVQRFDVLAREKQITLEWRGDPGAKPAAICATREGVDRILNNLISNAIKYTPSGGTVIATLRRVGGEVCLTVADTGIGIPKESLPHVFEEFYRTPNAKAVDKEGTGLGLAITRDLVTRYGGRIAVQSEVGRGAEFTIVFPTTAEQV